MSVRPEDLQATFCATLVDEWARDGVEHAVVCPGSRSTPLALALAADDRITVHVHHDERSGGFLALGLAAASGEAVVVLTTSGTAAVEVHPAVVEADLAGVPLLVCTANRPPELHDVGAPQAIDQSHLYGRSARWFHAPGVADEGAATRWRGLAARAHAEATGTHPGPVHLDLAFREPLVGTPGPLPPARPSDGAWVWRPSGGAPHDAVVDLPGDLAGHRGLLVAGAGSGRRDYVVQIATALGWPVLASPTAPVWGAPTTIPAFDALLRHGPRPHARAHRAPGRSARVARGQRMAGPHRCGADRRGRDRAGSTRTGRPSSCCRGPQRQSSSTGPSTPRRSSRSTAGDGPLVGTSSDPLRTGPSTRCSMRLPASEPGIARALTRGLPPGGALVASSSMPIRDLEWYAHPDHELAVHANRGANGIDGVVSTAVGVALGDYSRPTALLVGDVAFLHDSNGLLGAAQRGIDLVIVVVHNDGGGIFSFLPQAESVEAERFEHLYGTPHGLDLVALARAYGVDASEVDDVEAAARTALEKGGVHVLVARTNRRENVDIHRRLNAAVADAITNVV